MGMTRTEARKAARTLAKAGYSNVMLHETLDDGDVYVTGYNSMNVRRTVYTPEGVADLLKFSGR